MLAGFGGAVLWRDRLRRPPRRHGRGYPCAHTALRGSVEKGSTDRAAPRRSRPFQRPSLPSRCTRTGHRCVKACTRVSPSIMARGSRGDRVRCAGLYSNRRAQRAHRRKRLFILGESAYLSSWTTTKGRKMAEGKAHMSKSNHMSSTSYPASSLWGATSAGRHSGCLARSTVG
jgi:hypothetical protein